MIKAYIQIYHLLNPLEKLSKNIISNLNEVSYLGD